MSATALIVNRVQPRFATDSELAGLTALRSAGGYGTGDPARAALVDLVDNLAGYTLASDREEAAYAGLVAQVDPAPVYRVPLLDTDVHDLVGLTTVADLLFAQDGP
jgi:hypothetical protein